MKKNETRSFMIEQGYEMGRPSQIFLAITRKDGEVSSATISGSAVEISEGMLRY
jgi:trans-2,3-dihydro-3-hydroxyanthranilate isomerase